MAQIFTDLLAKLGDPRSLGDVSKLVVGEQEDHKVTNQFYHEGVLILEVISASTSQITEKHNNNSSSEESSEEKRRILILGHTVDTGGMVALQIKNKTDPWISHGLCFDSEQGSKKRIGQPAVVWCKGLAMLHTGNSFAYKDTTLHRMEQVTELMQLVCDNSMAWHELDFHALKVCQHTDLIVH